FLGLALTAILAFGGGCQAFLAPQETLPVTPPEPQPTSDVPRELAKVSLPPYVIEPPDILLIDVVKMVPKPPHFIGTFDVLSVEVVGTLIDQPITGPVQVGPGGKIDLGPAYGQVKVIDLTGDEAKGAIAEHLRLILQDPQVSVALLSIAGAQQIAGQHLVNLDGTVNLGVYGNVYVAGLTVSEARAAVEKLLSERLDSPKVLVDVFAYNSKVYYLITEGGGLGDNIIRVPITGNETVLDAISNAGGLSQLSSKNIWISRPAPNGVECEQILPIHWDDITRGASTATNYQLMPGDRLFIAADRMIVIDALVGNLTRPFERLLGFNILGVQMIDRFKNLGTSRRNFF
ncbi:MAG: polysaccharide biosynthesis/export family protein, partial [Pirellulales bacterium]